MILSRHLIFFLVLCATPVFLYPTIESDADLTEFDGEIVSQEDFIDEEEHERIARDVKEEEEEQQQQPAPDNRQVAGPKRQRPKPGNKRGNANQLGQQKKPNGVRRRPANQKKGQKKRPQNGQKKGQPNGQKKNQLKYRPRSPLNDQMNKMFDEVLKSFGQTLTNEVAPIEVKVANIPRNIKVQSWAYVKSGDKKPRTELVKPEQQEETVSHDVQQPAAVEDVKRDVVPDAVNSRAKRDEQAASSDSTTNDDQPAEEDPSPQADDQNVEAAEDDETENDQEQASVVQPQSENDSDVQEDDQDEDDEQDAAESQPSLSVVEAPIEDDDDEIDEDDMEFSNLPSPVFQSDGTVEYNLKLVNNFVFEDDHDEADAEDSSKQEDGDEENVKQSDDHEDPVDESKQNEASDHDMKLNQRGLHRNPKSANNQEATDPKEPESEAEKADVEVKDGNEQSKKKNGRKVPQNPNALVIGFNNIKRKGDVMIADRDPNTRVLKVPVAIGPLHLLMKETASPDLQNTRVKSARLSADFYLTEREGNVVAARFRRMHMRPRTSLVTVQRKDNSNPPDRKQSARLVTHLSREMARVWNSGTVLHTVGDHFRKVYVKNITPASKELPELKSLAEK